MGIHRSSRIVYEYPWVKIMDIPWVVMETPRMPDVSFANGHMC